jgi:hypothetical protein
VAGGKDEAGAGRPRPASAGSGDGGPAQEQVGVGSVVLKKKRFGLTGWPGPFGSNWENE